MAKQDILYNLHAGTPSPEISTFRNKIKNIRQANAQASASWMRKEIGITLEEQLAWEDSGKALSVWRSHLENMGIWVFKEPFKNWEYSGFYLPDKHFPIIYLNSSMPANRQIFTLLHEIGHFLIDKGGIDFLEDKENRFQGIYQKEESFCNAFASFSLVPDQDFRISEVPTDKAIEYYANRYKVSRETILRRCLDRGVVTRDFYNKKFKEWYDQWRNSAKRGGGNYYANTKVYLGEKYLTLAFKQYHQRKIDEYQLADYLGVKVKSLPLEEQRYIQRIFSIPGYRKLVSRKRQLEGGEVADPFVIAKAGVSGATVVANEQPAKGYGNKNSQASPKIPDVCRAFGIVCLSPKEFMAQESWKFCSIALRPDFPRFPGAILSPKKC